MKKRLPKSLPRVRRVLASVRVMVLLSVVVPGCASGTSGHGEIQPPARYPGELKGYEFFATAKWRELVPLESTLADVRRVMGEPSVARDIARYAAPYPGDDAAIQPVLRYKEVAPGWDLLVYLVRSDLSVNRNYPAHVQDRLLSLDLIPRPRRPFTGEFSDRWSSREVVAADAGWFAWSDGSGLEYQIYMTRAPNGDTRRGDLNRISYGPSDAQLQALGVRKGR